MNAIFTGCALAGAVLLYLTAWYGPALGLSTAAELAAPPTLKSILVIAGFFAGLLSLTGIHKK